MFKVLANNDTGHAPGHQAGIVIPAALRHVFPTLSDNTSESTPTIEYRINVELYLDGTLLDKVSTRYQYQTWGGTRSPESRVTDQLGALRNRAQGGDILIIQKSLIQNNLYRFILLRKDSTATEDIKHLIDGRRWGELYAQNNLFPTSTETKIVYIWIAKYKNLENFSLNLSSGVKFSYDEELNEVRHEVQQDLPKGFFPHRIEDVIAIIGKNGSGKSNALELICNAVKGAKSSIFSDFLVITQTDKSKRYNCFYQFKEKSPPVGKFIDFEPHSGNIKPLNVIFFSNVYDERRNDFDNEVVDLSVNGEIFLKNRPQNRWDITFLKQIDFLYTSDIESLGLNQPHAAQVVVNAFNSRIGIKSLGAWSDNLDKLYNSIRRRPGDMQVKQIKNRFVSMVRFLYLMDILQLFGSTRSKEPAKSIFRGMEKQMEIALASGLSTDATLTSLLDHLQQLSESEELLRSSERSLFAHPKNSDGQLLNAQFEFLTKLPDLVEDLDISHQADGIRNRAQESFIISHTETSRDFLKDFSRTMSFIRFMSLDWVGLSSGQKAYLNLFSKLTSALSGLSTASVLLCIDEGDLYLHPKWQADFLQRLLTVLSNSSNVGVQLVLTSHSPLLVSDLPRQNLEIMNGFSDADDKIETFGANIYDLYAGPLFLGELTSGLFSHLKLFELSKMAEKSTMTQAERKHVENYLSILGDEILRFKIENTTLQNNSND
ncbi:AAA family ATPase [Duganella sp. Leaf61]|uniref:AAA family ATPase n=1 Tax=Duganella sp. Leaf61 TaxID=1736227 RepID=UPI0012E0C862|nr:AAA family ATPase [Duganella sp. Leaf61]